MTLLKTFQSRIAEDAAGGSFGAGGSAGGMAMPLFSRLVQRSKPKAHEDDFVGDEVAAKAVPAEDEPVVKPNRLREHMNRLNEEDEGVPARPGSNTFDTSEVFAKLKGLENRESEDHRDTVTFGLEDDDKGLVRVAVKHEQAEDFEKALQAFMAEIETDEDRPEIAEILFKLKDRFDIVDVQWPDVQEDEEQDVDLQGQGAEGGEMDPNAAGAEGEMGEELPVDDASMGGGTGQVEDLLSQVIDMMKADAEARTADARAREAEAKNREAESIAKQASTRVKQEEQFLDMDTYNKARKEEDKEAKRLAQLSKWKHDMGGQGDDDFSGPPASISAPEDEESNFRQPRSLPTQRTSKQPAIRGKVHPHDVASFILNRVK